jgi:hypothetical protein
LKIDNNFSGETVVENCSLVRCGGFDHAWGWRGSLQICLDRRSVSGLTIRRVDIQDSISDGLTILAPGYAKGEGTLANTRTEGLSIGKFGLGAPERQAVWIREDADGGMTLVDSEIAQIRNDSAHFSVRTQ